MMILGKLFKRKIIEKPEYLYVDTSAIHGRGVFTQRAIDPGETIERSPLVLISEADSQLLKESILYDYYFMVANSKTPVAFAFGFGSVYNHAAPSNARYSIDLSAALIIIKADRFIRAGEEITINYNGHPEDHSTVTFTKRES
jgi:SET domain-containing protein